MDDLLLHDAARYAKLRARRRKWHRVLTFLAAIVVFSTTYALILPAITMTASHVHDESCYTPLSAVTEKALSCPAAEAGAPLALHRHDAECCDENGLLRCTLPEKAAHTHTDACYALPEEAGEDAEPVLICGQEELLPHLHDDACRDADGALVCTLPEVIVHQHDAACFTLVDVPVDPDALTCTDLSPEHVHGPLCYGAWRLTCDQGEDEDDAAADGGIADSDSPAEDDDSLAPDEEERGASQSVLDFYVYLDGEPHLVSSATAYLATENGRHYITAEALEEVYGKFGFSADGFNGERIFPHTDHTGPATLWADAVPYQAAADGGMEWRIPLSARNTCYVYYLPHNLEGQQGYFTRSQSVSDPIIIRMNSFYRVSISAPAGTAAESRVDYLSAGEDYALSLPALDGYTWCILNADGEPVTPTSAEPQADGSTLYTFSPLPCSLTVSAVSNAGGTGPCTIRYQANTLASCLQNLSGEVSAGTQFIVTDGTIGGLGSVTDRVDLSQEETLLLRSPDTQYAIAGTNAQKNQVKRFFYSFRGWRVKSTGDLLPAGTTLTAAQLSACEAGGMIELSAVWSALDERGRIASANFYINLNCEIKDSHGNGFSHNEQGDYTRSVFTTGMLGTGQNDKVQDNYLMLAPPTTDSAAYEVDGIMRAMTDTACNGITMASFPSDQDIFAAIRSEGYSIKIEGVEIPMQYLTADHFQIRWASLKYHASDGWHADGVLVAREAKLRVTKTFLGDEAAIERIKAQTGAQEYSILVHDSYTSGTDTLLTLSPAAAESRGNCVGYSSYDASSGTYTWIVGGHIDGYYTLSEQNYLLADSPAAAFYRVYETTDSGDWQSYADDGGVIVRMKSYPNDVSSDSYQTVAFRNYYVSAGTLTLRKIDSFTHSGLADVSFTLTQNDTGASAGLYRRPGTSMYAGGGVDGYSEKADAIVTDRNGDIFLMLSAGSYTLAENFPEGYSGASRIRFAVDDHGTLTSLTYEGGSAPADLLSGIGTSVLTVENHSRLLTTVTAVKDWGGVPEDWQKPVAVTLMCGGLSLGGSDGRYTRVLSAENDWTCVWEDLPLFIDGAVADYSLKETMIGDTAYDSSLDSADGYLNYAVTYDPAKYREGDTGAYDDPVKRVDASGTVHFANHVLLTVHNRPDGNSGEITVEKLFESMDGTGLSKIDGTYHFGVYDSPAASGVPLQTVEIVYGSGTVTPAGGTAVFTGLTIGKTYYVFELDDSGKAVHDGSPAIISGTPFTVLGGGEAVTLSADQPAGAVSITNRISYAELPETGGAGSGMLYAIGGVQAAGAALLLAGKKRAYRGKRERRG